MSLGSEHDETGRLLRDGSSVILQRDDGGRWRLDLGCGDEVPLGRRVRVLGTRCGFDRLAVRRVDLAD
jgi:hypothetical protein